MPEARSKMGAPCETKNGMGPWGRRCARNRIENERALCDQNAFGAMGAALCQIPDQKWVRAVRPDISMRPVGGGAMTRARLWLRMGEPPRRRVV